MQTDGFLLFEDANIAVAPTGELAGKGESDNSGSDDDEVIVLIQASKIP